LIDANCAAVIATAQSIGDTVAMELAVAFYESLAGGAGVESACNAAAGRCRAKHGDDLRALFSVVSQQRASQPDRWPWEMSIKPGAESARHWNLLEAAGDRLFGLPPLPRLDLPDSPFRNLSWLEREHAEVFFGRASDIRQIHDRRHSESVTSVALSPDGTRVVSG